MKVIGFVLDENKKFYDVNTMTQILGISKTKFQREIKRNNFSEYHKYKNQYLYPEKTLFNLMEIVLIEKLENDGLK